MGGCAKKEELASWTQGYWNGPKRETPCLVEDETQASQGTDSLSVEAWMKDELCQFYRVIHDEGSKSVNWSWPQLLTVDGGDLVGSSWRETMP